MSNIRIENGRYEGVDINERFVLIVEKSYHLDIIEDEKHVLLEYPEYADLRNEFFFNSV